MKKSQKKIFSSIKTRIALESKRIDPLMQKTPGCLLTGSRIVFFFIAFIMIISSIDEMMEIINLSTHGERTFGIIKKKIYPSKFDSSADALKYSVKISYGFKNWKYFAKRYVEYEYFDTIKENDKIEIIVSKKDPNIVRLKTGESTAWKWNIFQCLFGILLLIAAIKIRSFFKLILWWES